MKTILAATLLIAALASLLAQIVFLFVYGDMTKALICLGLFAVLGHLAESYAKEVVEDMQG